MPSQGEQLIRLCSEGRPQKLLRVKCCDDAARGLGSVAKLRVESRKGACTVVSCEQELVHRHHHSLLSTAFIKDTENAFFLQDRPL